MLSKENMGLAISSQDAVADTRYTLLPKTTRNTIKIYEAIAFETQDMRQLRTIIISEIQVINEESIITATLLGVSRVQCKKGKLRENQTHPMS